MRIGKNLMLFFGSMLLGMFIMAFIRFPPILSSDWAAWTQAIGSFAAICGTYFVARYQLSREGILRKNELDDEDAITILEAQQLASELAQMCVLSQFQEVDREGRKFYPDREQEFVMMRDLLDRIPLRVLVRHGVAEQIFGLKSISSAMGMMFREQGDLNGERFISTHRTAVLEKNTLAHRYSMSLAEKVREIAPTRYDALIRTHL